MTKILINTIVFQKEIQSGQSQYTLLNQLTAKIAGFEVRGELFKPETKHNELAQLQQLAEQRHWEFRYSIPECLFIKSEINPNLESHFKLAQQFGITALKISLGELEHVTAQQVTLLNQFITTYHVQLNIENEPNQNGILEHMAMICLELTNYNSFTGYTFDSGNWYWINETPLSAWKQLAPYTTVLHLKNIQAQETVLLDNGPTPWRQLCGSLASNIPVILEYPISKSELESELTLVASVLEA